MGLSAYRPFLPMCLGLLLGGCAYSVFGPEEHLDFSIVDPNRWQIGHTTEEPGVYALYEFVVTGETVDAWSELVSIDNTYRQLGVTGFETPRRYLEKLQALREKRCPGSTVWEVVEENESSILYRWRAGPCAGWPAQAEVARILDGTRTRFRVAYTRKGESIPEELMTRWIDALRQARVVIGGSTAAKGSGS